MVWEPEINELENRKKLAEQMGGQEGVAKQHSQGKLTVRERIVKLTDPRFVPGNWRVSRHCGI